MLNATTPLRMTRHSAADSLDYHRRVLTNRWSRISGATTLALAMIAGGLASACHARQDENPTPTPTTPSAPPARYTGLNGTCPTLTSDAAKKFGASGEGRVHGPSFDIPSTTTTRCEWGHTHSRPSLNVQVSIYHDNSNFTGTGTGDAQKIFSNLQTDDLKDASEREDEAVLPDLETEWGPAYIVVNSVADASTQLTLVENALIRVTIFDERRTADNPEAELDDLLHQHREPLRLITAEVIGNLR